MKKPPPKGMRTWNSFWQRGSWCHKPKQVTISPPISSHWPIPGFTSCPCPGLQETCFPVPWSFICKYFLSHGVTELYGPTQSVLGCIPRQTILTWLEKTVLRAIYWERGKLLLCVCTCAMDGTYVGSRDQTQLVNWCWNILLGPKKHLVKGHMASQADDSAYFYLFKGVTCHKFWSLMKGAISVLHTACVSPLQLHVSSKRKQ